MLRLYLRLTAITLRQAATLLRLGKGHSEQQGRALAAAAAERRRAEPAAPAAELEDERERDPGAGRAERVAERDRAAVHVHDVGRDPERVHGGDADGGERLVDLDQV